MQDDGVDIWGDGSTYKGNDIERFYRYGLLANPRLRIYKPWLDADFVTSSAAAPRCRRGSPSTACPTATAPRRRTRPTRTSGAPPTRPRPSSTSTCRSRSSSRSWACGSGTRPSRSRPRTSRSRSTQGRPVAINGVEFADRRSTSCTRPTRIGGRHGLGMSDQIENRIIEAKSRGIYEAPGMALLFIAYERLLNAHPQRGHHRELPRGGPPPRPPDVRGPLARPAGAHAARVASSAGSARPSPARSPCACAAATTTRSSTRRARTSRYHPDKLSMERVEDAAFGPTRPHRPAHHAQPRHRRLAREARAVRGAGPARAARPSSSAASSRAAPHAITEREDNRTEDAEVAVARRRRHGVRRRLSLARPRDHRGDRNRTRFCHLRASGRARGRGGRRWRRRARQRRGR